MTDKPDSSLARMLAVLDLFDEQRLSLTAEAIVDALQVSQPTAYRYVKLLTEAGLLQRQGAAHYTLGPRIVVLDHLIRRADRARRRASRPRARSRPGTRRPRPPRSAGSRADRRRRETSRA